MFEKSIKPIKKVTKIDDLLLVEARSNIQKAINKKKKNNLGRDLTGRIMEVKKK